MKEMHESSNDPLEAKAFKVIESENEEFGDGPIPYKDIAEALKPLDFSVSSKRVSRILARLGLNDRRKTSAGFAVFVNESKLEEARKKLEVG